MRQHLLADRQYKILNLTFTDSYSGVLLVGKISAIQYARASPVLREDHS